MYTQISDLKKVHVYKRRVLTQSIIFKCVIKKMYFSGL